MTNPRHGRHAVGTHFGIWTKDVKFLKFDANGNARAVQLLKSSSKSDHLRANVKGQVSGETLKVESLTLISITLLSSGC